MKIETKKRWKSNKLILEQIFTDKGEAVHKEPALVAELKEKNNQICVVCENAPEACFDDMGEAMKYAENITDEAINMVKSTANNLFSQKEGNPYIWKENVIYVDDIPIVKYDEDFSVYVYYNNSPNFYMSAENKDDAIQICEAATEKVLEYLKMSITQL